MITDPAALRVLQRRQLSRSVEVLLGMVTGILADSQLHDLEVKLLRSWLADNPEIASTWPGCSVAKAIELVLADGVISDAERAHLLEVLQQLAISDFSETGSAGAEVIGLPYDDEAPLVLRGVGVCHTGEFLHGTRAACERLTESVGGIPQSTVTRKTTFLVVGTNVSPNWAQTSYGRKIEQAMQLKTQGTSIYIVPERHWLAAMTA